MDITPSTNQSTNALNEDSDGTGVPSQMPIRPASIYSHGSSLATTIASDDWFVPADPALIRITGPYWDSLDALCECAHAEFLDERRRGSESDYDESTLSSSSLRPQQLLHSLASGIKREAEAAKEYFYHLRYRDSAQPGLVKHHACCLHTLRQLPGRLLRHASIGTPKCSNAYDPVEDQRMRQMNKLDEGVKQVPAKARKILGLEVAVKAQKMLGITAEDEKGGPLIPPKHRKVSV